LIRFFIVVFVVSHLFTTANCYAQGKSTIDKPLRIAVAANFAPILKILMRDFSKQTTIKSQLISGASGAMFIQIKHGAPFDVFLSADSLRPQQLDQSNLTVENSRKTYAIGQLALLSSTMTSLAQLQNPPKRFAIANPDISPYGKAAKETLQHLKLWQAYQNRLIKGLNIGQTFMQLRSKSVADGIVAQSQLVLNGLAGTTIPTSYHQPIKQQLVILKASKNKAKAQQFIDFILSPVSQKLIARYGYIQAPIKSPIEVSGK
jgi:molybdate transport system substrate-binding protein